MFQKEAQRRDNLRRKSQEQKRHQSFPYSGFRNSNSTTESSIPDIIIDSINDVSCDASTPVDSCSSD